MQKLYSLLLLLLFCFANVTNNTIQQYKMQEKVQKHAKKNRLCATGMHIYATLRALYRPRAITPTRATHGLHVPHTKVLSHIATLMYKIEWQISQQSTSKSQL